LPDRRWQVCWVRFAPESPRSVDGAMMPGMMQFDGHGLQHAILGLSAEVSGARNPGAMAVWVDVIERYVTDMLEPWQREPRLVHVWHVVQADLSRDWTLADLAALAHTSEEHLRRLCQSSLGRSPGKQLAALRMARAAHLLATTGDKISVIARAVGYANPYAFSNTFKRLIGFRPSDYRSQPHARKFLQHLAEPSVS